MTLANEIRAAASRLDTERARKARRSRQVVAAVARWKQRNPEKVSAQRRRWRERQATRA